MRKTFLVSSVALALGTWAGAAPAAAQVPVCPPGYFYASDGQCYPGPPPVYPPPVYDVAPPVYPPPVVVDGFGIGLGIGLGGFIGGGGRGDGGHRGGEHGGLGHPGGHGGGGHR
jgi:hypothetical protein